MTSALPLPPSARPQPAAPAVARVLNGYRNYWLHLAMIVLVLIPVTFAGLYGYQRMKLEMTQSLLAKRESISYLVATVLAERFDRLIDVGVSLSTRVRFLELIEHNRWNEAIEIMAGVPNSLRYVERIFLTDPNGILMTDTPALPGVRGKDFSFREWYRHVAASRTPYVSDIYKRAAPPQANVVAVAIPLNSRDKKTLLGILVLQVRVDVFFDWFKDAPTDPAWLLYILDRKGQTAFQSNAAAHDGFADVSSLPAVRRALNGGHGIDVGLNPIDQTEQVAAYAAVARYGWGAVLNEPAATAFRTRDTQLRYFLLIYAAVLALGILIAYLLLRMREEARVNLELERLVVERTAALETANKELETFSYSVSHDLRAPLRSIDGFSQILLDNCADKLDAQDAGYLRRVRAAAQRMGLLIDDLINLARVTRAAMRHEHVDLSALARAIADELRQAEPQRDVTVNIQPGLTAMGDASLLRVMLSNLLGNAWKFTGKSENAVIEFAATPDPAEHVFYVRDNGAGFDMQYADKLFDAFQRLHDAREFSGTGIGLATAQRIVRRHGGLIWAEGAVNLGATFYFTLQ